jgi:hypothetical protein
MTGPRPAGRPWTPAEEAQLRELIISRVKVGLIAKKSETLSGRRSCQDKLAQKAASRLSVQYSAPLAPFRTSGTRERSEQRARALTVKGE